MKREITASILSLALGAALVAPAFAQTDMGPNDQYGDPVCGAWTSGVWTPNGHCPGYTVGPRRARVAGTITAVRGHLVTLQMADRTLVINDQPALNREMSGRVAVGRQIVAYGYWRDGNFYATAME